MKKMIVLDGNSIMFRAYYATAYTGVIMQARSGIYTNAIYGFINMIDHIVKTPDMTNIFVAFDKGKKTLRHQAYEDYKGGRKKTPEEFLMQIPYIKEYLNLVNIKHLELDDYEADDIVGSIANKFKDEFDEIMVISGDRDLLQLAKGNIHVYLTKKGLTDLDCYTEENFFEKMGINVDQMCDYKGLLGDDSDNLPGITGVGPKTAQKLLKEYQTLENIIANVDNIKGKLHDAIVEDQDKAIRSKHLATLYTNVEIDVNVEDTKYEKVASAALRKFYEELDFNSFIKKMGEVSDEGVQQEIKVLDKPLINDLDSLLNDLKEEQVITCEVELTGENYHKAELLGLGITTTKQAYFFDGLSLYDERLKQILESDQLSIYAIDSKKVYCSLALIGIKIKKFAYDFILASYVINPNNSSSDLSTNLNNFINVHLKKLEDVYGKKTKYIIPSIDEYASYCVAKASIIPYVKEVTDKILKENNQTSLLYDIELPLSIVLGKMELNGFKIDLKRLNEIGEITKKEMDRLEKEIYLEAGMTFNIGSPKQLGEVLFEKLCIAKGKKNKTGYVTDAQVLEKLANVHVVPRLVLEYRKYAKLYSTYVVGLIDEVSSKTGKVHTLYKQALTLTGRLSSTEPNIQNIPIRTEDGRLIRSAFIPTSKDGILISADYSQIELRILAHVSNCKHMLEAFNNGIDLHASTAAKINNIDISEVTKEQRRIAKAVNFGIVYGMSAYGLSEELKIDVREASNFIDRYFEIYPEIKTYLNDVVRHAKENEYTTTLYNRRRMMKEINSPNGALRQFAERTAKNAPIQGTAADIIKIAMIEVDKKLTMKKLKSKLIGQVHDELVIDGYLDECEIVKKILVETMESVCNLKVKLNAEVSTGFNWNMK